eukprot:TRINITY_DN6216_c0_g3_i1.p1 TRINITY_DN6216_c0_g3~~TRINITY_DN6216_c0_g3_i1.p1  ORF type:complete len:105 (-),score=13.02 TRINITY_DN6216_c0_g3_i1:531-845(-)
MVWQGAHQGWSGRPKMTADENKQGKIRCSLVTREILLVARERENSCNLVLLRDDNNKNILFLASGGNWQEDILSHIEPSHVHAQNITLGINSGLGSTETIIDGP